MSSKYKGNIKKGDLVYIITQWGDNVGQPDYDQLYKIRSIGQKRAVVDTVDKTGQSYSYSRRGTTYELNPLEEAERNQARGFPHGIAWHWGQLFIPRGAEGWDPDFNV